MKNDSKNQEVKTRLSDLIRTIVQLKLRTKSSSVANTHDETVQKNESKIDSTSIKEQNSISKEKIDRVTNQVVQSVTSKLESEMNIITNT